MGKVAFIRLAEVINRKQDMRVVSVTVKPTITDCSGTIYFTDLQLQEGAALTGYTPHTEVFLQKFREDGGVKAPVWFNGVVRGEETVILFNLGETSAGLDVHLYPKSDMEGGSVKLAQGVGGQKVSFSGARVYWANQAAYRWKLRGMCMWSLGQEDMRLWEYLPKQI